MSSDEEKAPDALGARRAAARDAANPNPADADWLTRRAAPRRALF
jgi:hypothetical protein